jgi:hypothetical protein
MRLSDVRYRGKADIGWTSRRLVLALGGKGRPLRLFCSHNDQLTKGIDPRAALAVVAIHSKISRSICSYPCMKKQG